MHSHHFNHYIQRAQELLKQGHGSQPAMRTRSSAFSDEDRNIMNAARSEVVLCDARTRLSNSLSADCVQLWMRPEFFPTPYSSIAATLTGHLVVPVGAEQPQLQMFLDVLRSADFPMRWALAEAMEAAYYCWLPAGASVEHAFAAYGITLTPSKS